MNVELEKWLSSGRRAVCIRPMGVRLLANLAFICTIASCNFRIEKDVLVEPELELLDPDAIITFEDVRTKILEPSCLGCHAASSGNQGGVNLEDYKAVASQIQSIKRSTVDNTYMPKGRRLDRGLVALLAMWIERGAPENAE